MPQRYPYGTVLKIQREQTFDTIRRDLENIRQLGFNTVVIWPAVYWWEDRTQPAYPFQTGRQLLTVAAEFDLRVIMELAGQITALEYAPDALMKPDYYATRPDGTPDNRYPYYQYLNYNHPEVRALITDHFRTTARQYRDFPALYGYDILNETMFSSYDPHTMQQFRTWLRAKYATLDALNDAWERHYTHWNQIEYSTWMWASVMPWVDWQQFRKDNMNMILAEWRTAVNDADPDHPVLADNIHAVIADEQSPERPQDDWGVAAQVNEYGISFYPKEDLVGRPPVWRWQTLSGARAATPDKRFWIAEMQTHHRNMYRPASVVEPHQLAWWIWEAVAHGARGVLFWMWNPFTKGWQTGGRGFVNRRGEITPRAEAAAAVQQVIQQQEALFVNYRPEQPRVAILYDRLAHDFSKAFALGAPEHSSIYLDSMAGLYACLWAHNVPVTFITPADVRAGRVDDYRAVFVTNQLNLSPSLAAALGAYVTRGGTLICDGKWGDIGNEGLLYEHAPGGPLNLILGWDLDDIDPVGLGFAATWDGVTVHLPGYLERQNLRIRTDAPNPAEVLGTFADGEPAVFRSRLRHGQLIAIATHLWYGYHKQPDPAVVDFVGLLSETLELAPHAISDNRLKLAVLRDPAEETGGRLVLVFNYERGERTARFQLRTLPPGSYTARELGQDVDVPQDADFEGVPAFTVRVPSQGVAVVHIEPRA